MMAHERTGIDARGSNLVSVRCITSNAVFWDDGAVACPGCGLTGEKIWERVCWWCGKRDERNQISHCSGEKQMHSQCWDMWRSAGFPGKPPAPVEKWHGCRLGSACPTHNPKPVEPYIPSVDEFDLLRDA
jgi:hypothetical protein